MKTYSEYYNLDIIRLDIYYLCDSSHTLATYSLDFVYLHVTYTVGTLIGELDG